MSKHYLHAIAERRVSDYAVAGKARCHCGELFTAFAASPVSLQRVLIRKHKRHKDRARRDAKVSA